MQDPYVRYPRNANFSKENVNQVRKRRAKKDTNQPGSQYPSTYSDFNFMPSDQFDNFDAQEQFLNPREQGLQVGPALKAKAEVQRKVGLRLPVKHKAIARSCVSKKKKSNWVNYENEDMVQTRTRKPLSLKGPPSEQVPLSQDFYSYDFDQFAEPEEPYVDYSGLQQYQYPVQGIPMDGMSMKAPPSGGILPGMSGQQKMKLGFALLMVPSLIVMMTSHKKFNSSSSNSNIDMSALKAAGFSGLPGLGAAGGGGQLPTEGYGSENIANLLKGRRKPTATAKYDVPDYDDLLGFAAHGRESSPESSSSPTEATPEAEGTTEKPEVTTPDTGNNLDIMIEPQEASNQFADDYDVNEIRDLPFGQVPFQSPALMPATEPPKGNPDPHLVVEQEELPAQLFQVPDAITPLAREGDSVVQLKQNGFNIVLLWSLFEDSVLASGQEPFKLSNCKKSDCFVTRDRSQLADADAIIIHISETVYPEKRAQNQLWVLYIDRPDSTKSYPDLVRSHQFNLTWTYRQDSDIISSAAYFIESTHRIGLEQNLLDNSLFDKWRYKSLMLMITQNKCEPNELIEQLKALTDVAIYGECGKPLCQGHDNHINCYPVVAKKHLFALDLTSESCSPLTQNVVSALDSSLTIPIVLNKTKSSLTCPPDSMIAASDFKSARDLADYLNFVGSDFNQYKKFFNWKRQFELTKEKLDGCQLCEIIGDKSRQHVYTDIGSWIDKDSCLN